jgi:hypothetical protein
MLRRCYEVRVGMTMQRLRGRDIPVIDFERKEVFDQRC